MAGDVHIASQAESEVDGEIHTRKSFCCERASWMASAGVEVFHIEEKEEEATGSSGSCGLFSSSASIVVDLASLVPGR